MQKQQEQNLEETKRREYEAWLKSQQEQAEEYRACVKYQGPSTNTESQKLLVQGNQQQQFMSTTTLQQNVSSQQITSKSESRVSTEQNEPKPQTVIQQPASTQPTSLLGGGNKVVMRESGYQKHSVKSMANRFATFQPKTEIPLNILPDLRNFNGQEGPKLNYLSNNSTQGRVTPAATKRVGDQKDFESSRLAYEQKKTQQVQQQS